MQLSCGTDDGWVCRNRIKVGQYRFHKHGGKVVFFGPFVALLRILAAFLTGVNRMPWHDFLVANAAGGVLWAAVFGLGGYYFGKLLFELHAILAGIVFAMTLGIFFGASYVIRRYEHRLVVSAARARQTGRVPLPRRSWN
jgi:membrane protein DedA with SNARE-associated domain